MITEDEARKKWCPYSQMYSFSGELTCSGGWNRVPPGVTSTGKTPEGSLCIASDCMCWEWLSGKWEGEDLGARTPDEGNAEYIKRGDCGLKRK